MAGRPSPCRFYGDVNGDGVVDSFDYQMIADYVTGKIALTPDQLTRADVTGDGNVTMADALWVQRYIDGDVNTFPVCGGTPTKHTIRFTVPSGSTVRVIK